jgi:hypothetical protein
VVGVDNAAQGSVFNTAKVMARRLVSWYDGHLRNAPIRTKAVTSFTILTGADLCRQRFFEAPPRMRCGDSAERAPRCEDRVDLAPVADTWWDKERTARMALFSCSLHPIWVHQ